MKLYISGLFYILLSTLTFADNFIKSCKILSINNDNLEFNVNKSAIFFVHNITANDVWLIANNNAVNLNNKLIAKQWSALILTTHLLKFSCIESRPGHEQRLSCANLITVCQTTMKTAATATSWDGKNMSKVALLRYTEDRSS